jgi:hypothetical protein
LMTLTGVPAESTHIDEVSHRASAKIQVIEYFIVPKKN